MIEHCIRKYIDGTTLDICHSLFYDEREDRGRRNTDKAKWNARHFVGYHIHGTERRREKDTNKPMFSSTAKSTLALSAHAPSMPSTTQR